MINNLVDRVRQALTRYSMLQGVERLGVAVSGGADSIALLHILRRLEIELAVLHVNHGLRGVDSDLDESFVRDLSLRLGVPCTSAKAKPQEGNLEQEARLIRRQLFRQWMDEFHLDRVALGHTRTDQAETVLFRLLRGSGPTGLSAMLPITEDGLIRPLLGVSRHEIREWAQQESIGWRDDASNEDLRFSRNRLRQVTIPALALEYNPNLEPVLAGTAELLADEENYWKQEITALHRKIAKRTPLGSFFQVADLENLPVAVRRRLIRQSIRDTRGDLRSIEREHVESILALCRSTQGHNRVIIPGVDAIRSYGCLLVTVPGRLNRGGRGYHVPLTLGKEEEIAFGAGRICVDFMSPESSNCANFKNEQDPSVEIAYLDGDVLAGEGSSRPLYVRNWEPGDAIVQPGHQKAVKIKELFGENRILLWHRRHWPVVAAGSDIVWVRRFGANQRFVAYDGSRRVLRLRYRSGNGDGT